MMTLKVAILAAIATAAIGVGAVTALLSTTQIINNTGNVNTVGGLDVYWDSAGTNRTTTINWGTMSPGDTKGYTVYVKNVGNTALTLSMSTSAWNPSAAVNSIHLTWNCTGYQLQTHDAIVAARLSLAVDSDITGITNFSFNTTITGN